MNGKQWKNVYNVLMGNNCTLHYKKNDTFSALHLYFYRIRFKSIKDDDHHHQRDLNNNILINIFCSSFPGNKFGSCFSLFCSRLLLAYKTLYKKPIRSLIL